MTGRQEDLLGRDMHRVVDKLHSERTHVTPYQEDYRRLLDNQGKMIRASMVLLFARAVDPTRRQAPEEVITGAAAIEMLHLATLVHDDVLDQADMRRNRPTVHTVRGNKAAIYLGDLILSRYMEIMAGIAPDTAFIREQAGTVCEIVGGELYQESGRHNTDITVEYYDRAIGGKTAALFRLACLTGTHLGAACADREGTARVQALEGVARTFGENLGMAFQIMDDIEDFDVAHDTGKPKLEDIRDGIYTLPVLLGLQEDPSFKDLLERDRPGEVLGYLQAHATLIGRSRQAADSYLDRAEGALEDPAMDPGVTGVLKDMVCLLHAHNRGGEGNRPDGGGFGGGKA
ncbi:polyprenyl synthetase family protein [Bifidobacterium favimelis]|uniref:Polyprenyl synthetase family protein n=1 Tax=Bifidobacterium favimelis TaxID=3122979 RepID=A0ABU8ZQ59_9BIFI